MLQPACPTHPVGCQAGRTSVCSQALWITFERLVQGGVKHENHEMPLPEGCCRHPGLCTDMLASELPASLSLLLKLVGFELESLANARLPRNVVSIKWKRIKGRDFPHQVALWAPGLVKSSFLQNCDGKCDSVWTSLFSKVLRGSSGSFSYLQRHGVTAGFSHRGF